MRYALYFSPPEDDALAIRASAWLGWDALQARALPQAVPDHFDPAEFIALTAEPRRYGFHATLKAPIELAADRSEAELLDAFDSLADATQAFDIPQIALGQLGPFFALVPAAQCEPLQELGAACVTHFEPFRAPLSDADIARRRPERLTDSERSNLMTWGYPYVFNDFRFHMTLTGQVPAERQPPMRAALEAFFAEFIDRPLTISHLALFIEPERGAPFTMKRIAPLRTVPERKTA